MPQRPPKWWMDRCVAGVRASGSADDPQAVCGDLWFNKLTDAQRRARIRKEVNPPELRAEAFRNALRPSSALVVPMVEVRPMSREERKEERLARLWESIIEHEDVLPMLLSALGGAMALYPAGLRDLGTGTAFQRGDGSGLIDWKLDYEFSTVLGAFLPHIEIPGLFGASNIDIALPNRITVTVTVSRGRDPDFLNLFGARRAAEDKLRLLMLAAGIGFGVVSMKALSSIFALAGARVAPS